MAHLGPYFKESQCYLELELELKVYIAQSHTIYTHKNTPDLRLSDLQHLTLQSLKQILTKLKIS